MTNLLASLSTHVFELTSRGAEIIRLDIGSPDLPPAPHIIEALSRTAARPDAHGYQPLRGTRELRQAWAALYELVYGVSLADDEILPLLGSKEGIFHLSLAWLRPGDLVLTPDPSYPTYAAGARLVGAEVIHLPLLPENNFLPDLEAIPPEIAQRARLMWLNYPHNPTAAVASREFFERAVSFCRRYDILLCHDAAYTQITFDGLRAPSVLEVDGAREIAVEFNTLSKSHNMAGWRVGVVVGRRDALDAIQRVKANADSGHFRPVIEAAIAALTGDQSWLSERNAIYASRREVALHALREMGLNPYPARASLYIWFPLPEGWTDSFAFVRHVLDNTRVALAPGIAFGPRGEGYIRLSLVQPGERLTEALQRLQDLLTR